MIPEYNFTIHTGQDILIPIQLVDSNNNPEVLTGYDSFSCEFRKTPGDTLLGTATIVLDDIATGQFSISISKALSLLLEPNTRVAYDVFAIAPDGSTKKLLMGLECEIVRRVTRTVS